MEVKDILAAIDAEISKLQQARSLLAGTPAISVPEIKKPGRGRPKGSKNASSSDAGATGAKKAKRNLTPEGRKAIAEAMKRRWAERKKGNPA